MAIIRLSWLNSDKDDLLLKDSTLQRFLGKPINAFGSRMVKITHMGIYFHGEKEFVYVDDQLNFTFFVYKNSYSRNVVSETRIPKPAFLLNTEISLNNADGILKSWI